MLHQAAVDRLVLGLLARRLADSGSRVGVAPFLFLDPSPGNRSHLHARLVPIAHRLRLGGRIRQGDLVLADPDQHVQSSYVGISEFRGLRSIPGRTSNQSRH